MDPEGTRKLNYLLDKFRQERPGMAPWPFINTLSDNELRRDLRIAQSVPDGPGGVVAGWLAMALRMRPALLEYPASW
jgi:hypothetical protein